MDYTEILYKVFMSVYTFVLAMVSVYGLHRYLILFLYYRHRKKRHELVGQFEQLPPVTIQLPMYNERFVARRIIASTCQIDYPRDKLQIQVLDDSTDETSQIAAAAVAEARKKGVNIEYIHRDNRDGYKAGALTNGLKSATGEFISIFDADFVPVTNFLTESIPHFINPRVCVVQTRWDHINRNDSLLTRTQAILLDGHFVIEHVARNRSGRFISFNGTAGTWRRAAIDDAGGWHQDTLTEDLDLSYRAQLKGWKFVFLPELTAPAELPPEMDAFKAQQFRWTKGGAQTAMKMLPRVLLSSVPLKVKIESFFHLTCFSLHLYVIILVLMLFPAMYMQCVSIEGGSFWRGVFDLSVFTLATLSASAFYIASQIELSGDWRRGLKFLPVVMALGIGLSVSNTKAIIEALFGKKSEFVRTPKYAGNSAFESAWQQPTHEKRKFNPLPYVEFLFGIYMAACTVWCLLNPQAILTVPFLVMFCFGFFYVSVMSFQVEHARRTAETQQRKTATMRA